MSKLKTIRVGVSGWYGRGGDVAMEFRKMTAGLIEPTACVDPFDENYEAGCKIYGHRPERYASIREMLAADVVDALIIGSPNNYHLDNLRECAEHPVPVLLEKPLDASFETVCDVVRFSQSYPKPIIVGHCMRYAPILIKAREIVARGDIGRVCSARFVQHCDYGNSGYHNWRRAREKSGTWMIEKATHDLDIMLWMLDKKPSSVVAMQRLQAYGGDKPNDLRCRDCDERLTCPESLQNINRRWGIAMPAEIRLDRDLCAFSRETSSPDSDHCMIAFEDGVVGTYEQWFFSPRSYHHRLYEVWGTEGAMEVDLGACNGGNILVCKRYGTAEDDERYHFDYLGRNHYNGDANMPDHCYAVFTGQAEPRTTVVQAFLAELIGFAAIRSADEGRLVEPMSFVPSDLQPLLAGEVY